MGLPQIIARNQQQSSNKRTIFRNDTSGYPITYYTCPAGKVARITGNWLCDDTGAAATVDLVAASVSIAEVQATGGGTDPNIPQDLAEGLLFQFEANLAATETLQCTQNTGTNANTKINASIEEFII